MMVDKVEAPDPTTNRLPAQIRHQHLPAGARRSVHLRLSEGKKLDKDPHWYEKNILGRVPSNSSATETGQSITGCATRIITIRGRLSRRLHRDHAAKQATRLDAIRSDRAAAEFRARRPRRDG
jgi:hypothetical protein